MNKFLSNIIVILLMLMSFNMAAQCTLRGKITGVDAAEVEEGIVVIKELGTVAEIQSNGEFIFSNLTKGNYSIAVIALQLEPITFQYEVRTEQCYVEIPVTYSTASSLQQLEILEEQERTFGIQRLQRIQNFTLYEGKKNEVILLKNLTANTATNNARQIFGGITGLNIWESDGAGLQLGIGGRGLSPNRTSNFNTRQNGYDISADALGYPESYYTPPTEVLEQIEVIRGAASLQYGTQFGGMVNFTFKKPNPDKRFEFVGRQTVGSWNFLNSFNSISGTSKNKKFSYLAYYQHKQGEGWRPNSNFELDNAFVHLGWTWNERNKIELEYTHMDYLAKQPGGLTDLNFQRDPQQSLRSRNWFRVDWELAALNYTHKFSKATQFNWRTFALNARRQSLGNLERINVIDFNQNRTLIDGQFRNIGSEARVVHRYEWMQMDNAFIAGVRLYRGNTRAVQGEADDTDQPNFSYLQPDNVEGSDYVFPNYNLAAFLEHIFTIGRNTSITPGVRFEHITTRADGYYRQRVFDFAGNVVADNRINETLNRERSFVIAGLGIQHRVGKRMKVYGNISQNYRAINFTDLRIQNPNFRIDPNLQDERGYTADLGIKGDIENVFSYELTGFYLYYSNRIGQILRADQAPLFIDYRYRTNVSASRNVGIEAFGALNIRRILKNENEKWDWSVFVNGSLIDARYINSDDSGIEGNEVEMVPPVIVRTGTNFSYGRFRVSYQFNYVSEHFSDASNAVRTATAVEGLIPSYMVSDVSMSYDFKKYIRIEASCNNVFNESYFTRRAESYPGPGIIPSDPRSFFLTLLVRV
jgi:Fe(3+) dicitrate transport protein